LESLSSFVDILIIVTRPCSVATLTLVPHILKGDGQARERIDSSLRSYGLKWHVVFAFEFMLETLEEAKKQEVDKDHANYWHMTIDCALNQLDKYYQLLDDCLAY
jgi:hypothetical protein